MVLLAASNSFAVSPIGTYPEIHYVQADPIHVCHICSLELFMFHTHFYSFSIFRLKNAKSKQENNIRTPVVSEREKESEQERQTKV